MSRKIICDVDISKTYLSSEVRFYKTESFFLVSKKIVNSENFILKIAEHISKLLKEKQISVGNFNASTIDHVFNFDFVIRENKELQLKEVIFYKLNIDISQIKYNDMRIQNYIHNHPAFTLEISETIADVDKNIFLKLYLISSFQPANLPMLSLKQKEIVELANNNVVVQGVAGSGKTNLCLSKIILIACQNYSGKILYTTFSKGLILDTETKIKLFAESIDKFIENYKLGKIEFLDNNKKKAIENYFGIFLVVDTDENILSKLSQIVVFLKNKVDFYLIEDFYKIKNLQFQHSNENTFLNNFLKKNNDYQLIKSLNKIKNNNFALVYKEIYGLIYGLDNEQNKITSKEDYIRLRENNLSKQECEIIYSLALSYKEFQNKNNLLDNNEISRRLLDSINDIKKYSVSIIDEVQDFTEINLKFLRAISIKMFCVGDALQMINPSYFHFSYLKRLLYNEDVTDVVELENNYRNNKKIVEALDELSAINISEFGTHSFIVRCKSIDDKVKANLVYVKDKTFLDKISDNKFENYTILVSTDNEKYELKKKFPKQEILTISEIKGLERDTVLLYNILSSNKDKWNHLENLKINHKTADENSVYRYYFNLFYVGLSRAKQNIFVYEDSQITQFNKFFNSRFENLNVSDAYDKFTKLVGKSEIDELEIHDRINEFIKLGQFENAKFYAYKIKDDKECYAELKRIEIYEKYIFQDNHKQAGIELWKIGRQEEATNELTVAGETNLLNFLVQIKTNSDNNIDAEIIKYYLDFDDNKEAKSLIIETLKNDLSQIKEDNLKIRNKIKEIKEKKHGK